MGTWGTGILQDDFACDIYHEYLELWDEGKVTPAEIQTTLEADNADSLNDFDEGPIFWLSLARAQWECGVLPSRVQTIVEDLIQSGKALEPWEGTMHPANYGRRRGVLTRFLTKIQKPPAKIRNRPRRKRNRWKAPYSPGDCLAVPLSEGDWGAALVVATDEAGRNNLVALLRYRSKIRPDETFFLKRNWLTYTDNALRRHQAITWCDPCYREEDYLEVIAQIEILDTDPKTCPSHSGWYLNVRIEQQLTQNIADT